MRWFTVIFLMTLALAGCDRASTGGPLDVVVIGQDEDALERFAFDGPLNPAARHILGATREGLVAMDPSGEIVPAIAERWIVTEDGLSYIFRLRNSDWSEGEPITAEAIRIAFLARLAASEGTSLGFDLAKVEQVRAMTGRVIEIQLKGPMPDFLRLLAQPEMGLAPGVEGVGPMAAEVAEDSSRLALSPLPPETRGFPAMANWDARVRPLYIRSLSGETAVAAFANGEADLVLSGTLAHLPLADTGPLSAGTVRLDAPLGLFGLQVMSADGVLSDPARREAIAMAIDRSTLMQPFNFGGWQTSTWIYPLSLVGLNGPQEERWARLSLEQRRAIASNRITAWSGGIAPPLYIWLPTGPGSDLLFAELAGDLSTIGLRAVRAKDMAEADLALRDELARYYSPRWYLNQFNCALEEGLCSLEADALVQEALESRDLLEKSTIYAEAQQALIAEQVFIPLGQPVRWSLVRAGVPGFEENQWGLHPLFPLSLATI